MDIQDQNPAKTFLSGALFGAVTSACLELWLLRKQWQKAKESGRDEERLKLEGEIARGGMGAILKIWDEDIRRHLAMKVILGAGKGSEDASATVPVDLLQRFLDEAQISGQLDHPGVVPVYELGIDAGCRAYFTMPVVEGRER